MSLTATPNGGCSYPSPTYLRMLKSQCHPLTVTGVSRPLFIYIFLKATPPLSSSSCQALPLIPRRLWHLTLILPLHTCAHAKQLWTKMDAHWTISHLEPVMVFGILLHFAPSHALSPPHPALLTLHFRNYHTRPSVQHSTPRLHNRTTGSPNTSTQAPSPKILI